VNPGGYGRIVRIDITEQIDASSSQRLTAVPLGNALCAPQRLERINNRIDNSFSFEKHFIRGQAKMKTRMDWRWRL